MGLEIGSGANVGRSTGLEIQAIANINHTWRMKVDTFANQVAFGGLLFGIFGFVVAICRVASARSTTATIRHDEVQYEYNVVPVAVAVAV
jgi:hypothetical protein